MCRVGPCSFRHCLNNTFFGLNILFYGPIGIVYCIAPTIPIKRILEAGVHVKKGVWVPKTNKSEGICI